MSNATPTNPYIGPRSFEEGEGARFFGRERELEELFHLLLARRLVLLHAPSGAGKSSLVRAALIPRLRDEGFLVRPIIRVGTELTVRGPNRFCVATLLSLDEGRAPAEHLPIETLATLSLADYLAREPATETEEVFIFDQFEEVLSADPNDRATKAAFFSELGTLLENPRRWALFLLREDYLGALKPLLQAIPTRLAATYRLDLLDPTQARQAMQGPARAAGGTFADDAAARLADDLRQTSVQRPDGSSETVLGQSIDPVQLQVVCYRLWARQASHAITVADIDHAGDVDTALRSYYAEQVATTAAASGVGERQIRTWVQAQLITETGLRGQVLRAPAATGGLANAAIALMVNAHLLRAEERRGATWYELAHDRLIAPVRQNNAAWFEANLSVLQRQAALWDEHGRQEGLLLRGAALQRVKAATDVATLNETEHAFLVACRARARQLRRTYVTNLLIFALAISALGLLYEVVQFFFKAQNLAVQGLAHVEQLRTAQAQAEGSASAAQTAQAQTAAQGQVTDAQRLALAAQNQIASDASRALLLAYEAAARDLNLNTRDTLRQTLAVPVRTPLTLGGHRAAVWSAAYSPDGQRIVTASEDRTAIIWDATSGAKLFTLQGHGGEVFSAAYSPDGQRIVTASADRTAIIWDAANGTKLATLRSHTGAVLSAAFSPDGRRIVTASKDRTAQQHMNLSDDDMVLMAQCRFWRSFTPGESAGFGVYEPFAFSLTNRQCPPVYSWQRPQP